MTSVEFDKGPIQDFARIFAACPPPVGFRQHFWFDWGPVFYRGRLNGSARILCIASDPGATERLVGRTLVGDAGQRVQGFLAKLGLTRSYLGLNAFPYSFFPGSSGKAKSILRDPEQLRWRNRLYDRAATPGLQAIVAFGKIAQTAVAEWPGRPDVPLIQIPHPSSRFPGPLITAWRGAVTELREIVTPDPDGDPSIPNYGDEFTEVDYAPIPRRDLPFGPPAFVGDDRWRRELDPRAPGSVDRPDTMTINWLCRPEAAP